MAKRKRINKPVLIILIVLGSLTVLGGGFFGYGFLRYGANFPSRMMNWMFPRDPLALERKGDAAFDKEDYAGAVDAYNDAAKAASGHAPSDQKRIYFKHGRAMIKHAQEDETLTKTEVREIFLDGVRWVRKAATVDPRYVEPLRLLVELEWARVTHSLRNRAVGSATDPQGTAPLERFVELADQYIAHEKDADQLHQAYFRRGLLHTQMYEVVKGDHDAKALSDLNEAVTRKPDEPRYWGTLVEFLFSLDRGEQARDKLDKALLANPDSVDLNIRKAKLTWTSGQRDKALADLGRITRGKAGQADGFLALAELLVLDGKSDQALTTLATARKQIPTDPRLGVKLAEAYLRGGQVDKAVDLMRSERNALADQDAKKGTLIEQQRRKDALWQLTYALASTQLDQAHQQSDRRAARLDEARVLVPAVQQLRPDSPEAHKLVGRLAMFEGDWPAATESLQKAWAGFSRRRRGDLQAALLLASVLLRQNQPLAAEQVVDNVLRRSGQGRNARFLIAKAQIRMKLKDYEGAHDLTLRVLRQAPANSEALALKSTLDALRGRQATLPEKITNPRMIVRQLRDHAETLWFEDQRDEAVALIEELHSRLPDELSVTSQLADMYLAGGNVAGARKLLSEAAKKHPNEEPLAFRLKLLDQKTPEARLALRRQRAQAMQDPYRRALELAGIAQIENRPAEHVQQLLAALENKPSGALAAYVLRRTVTLGNWPAAEKCAALAAKANVDGQEGRLIRGRLALVRGKPAEADKLLQQVLAAHEQHTEALALWGQCLLAQGKADEAEKSFQAALAVDPAYVDAVLGMVQVTQAPDRQAEHANWVTQAARLAPRNRYLRQRALAVRARGATDPKELTKMLAECDRLLGTTAPGQQLGLRAIRADLLERTGQIQQAGKELRWIYDHSKDALAAATLRVSFLVRTDQRAEADGVMADLLKRTRDRAGAYVLYGLALSLHSPSQAMAAFGKARAEDNKDPRVYLAISRHYSRQGNWKKAADALARHIELAGKGAKAQKELVLLRLEAGQYDQAARRLQAILTQSPQDAGALTLRGFLLRKEGKDDQALQHFTRAMEIDPDYILPRVLRAQVYLDRGMRGPALEDLQNVRKRPLQDPTIRMQVAMAYFRLGDLTTTEAELTELLREHRNHLPAVRELVRLYTEQEQWYKLEPLLVRAKRTFPRDISFLLAWARLYSARKDRDRELSSLASAYELAPQSEPVVRAYLTALLSTGKPGEAHAVARSATASAEMSTWARAAGAHALADQGKHDQAQREFAQALVGSTPERVTEVADQMSAAWGPDKSAAKAEQWLAAEPKNWRAGLLAGVLESRRAAGGSAGALAQATKAYESAAAHAPDDQTKASAWRGLARAMSAAGKPAEAVRAYLKSLTCHRDHVPTLNNLAYVLANDVGKPDQALPHAERVFALAPADANVLDTYGWTLAKLGRYDQARHRLEQAVLRGRPSPSRRYHLGWVLEHMPKPPLAEAHKQYTRALASLDSSKDNAALSRQVRTALARVKQKMSRRID